MIFVCAILTPIIYFWYQFRYGTLKKELDELLVNNSKVSSIDGKESTKVEDVKSDEEDVEKKD
jgi:hypothetical protein